MHQLVMVQREEVGQNIVRYIMYSTAVSKYHIQNVVDVLLCRGVCSGKSDCLVLPVLLINGKKAVNLE